MAFDGTRQDAVNAVTAIYAEVGHTAGADEFNDMDNRIRNGQTLAELVANTYDDAQRRFKTVDTPASRAAAPTAYDAQLNMGRSFDPPAVMLETLAVPSREQAEMMNGNPPVSLQMRTPSNTPRYNVGPAAANYGAGGGVMGGLSLGTILIVGGGVIVAYVLYKKLGKK